METQYIYLLQEREFIKTNENIFKIGKTKQNNNDRLKQYPKGSVLLFQIICSDCDNIERRLIKIFKEKYKQCKQIGNEYFDGDKQDMIKTIYDNITNEIVTINDTDDCDEIADNDENTECTIDNDDEYKIEQYEINGYEDLKKFTGVYKIIITNKDTKEGYLKFPEQLYRKLYNKYLPDFIEDEIEDLIGYINNFKEKYDHAMKYNNEIIGKDDFMEIYKKYNDDENFNYKFIDLIYNEEKLIKDIIEKCYVKKPHYYEFKYNEYLVNCSGNYDGNHIFNSDKMTFDKLDNYNEEGIIDENCSRRTGTRINIKDVSTTSVSIVEKILNWLIVDKSKINQYKQLCYSVFVKPTDKPIVFYDYRDDHLIGYLTMFCRDLCHLLMNRTHYIDSNDYYEDILNYKKLIKKNNVRLVVIRKHKKYTFEKMINDFIKLGIKNIIVNIQDKTRNIYNCTDQNALHLYLKEIKDEILLESPKNIHFDYDIFLANTQLLFNYILWCCSI